MGAGSSISYKKVSNEAGKSARLNSGMPATLEHGPSASIEIKMTGPTSATEPGSSIAMEPGESVVTEVGKAAATEPGESAVTEPEKAAETEPGDSDVTKLSGTSDRDWMYREMEQAAIDFRIEFEKVMCEDIFENVEEFMANSYEHPRFVWLDLLLSSPSKNKGSETKETKIASLMWKRLMKYFPDVLHRELFLDVFYWVNSDEKLADRFGPLHGAVLCGLPEVVKLLSDHRTNAKLVGKGICQPLREYHHGKRKMVSEDCFDTINRAVLWSQLPGLCTRLPKSLWSDLEKPSVYEEVAAFLKQFKEAKDSKSEEGIQRLIRRSAFKKDLEGRLSKNEWSFQVWTVILAWAHVFERNDIVEKFRNLRPQLFKALTDRQPWKKFFSDFVETTDTKEETVDGEKEFPDAETEIPGTTKELNKSEGRVDVLMKILDQVMIDVQGPKASQPVHSDIVMQLCSAYNLAYRTPPDTRKSRWTAVHLAAAIGDHHVMDSLIACYDLVIDSLPETMEIKFRGGSSPIADFLGGRFVDTCNMTPLHHAALGHHCGVIKSLLKWGFFSSHVKAGVNAIDIFKRTSFQIACSKRSKLVSAVIDQVSTVKKLLSSPDLDPNISDCCGFTPLHWAVATGATEVVRVLIDQKNTVIRTTVRSADEKHPHRVAEGLDALTKRNIQDLLMCSTEVKELLDRLYRDRQIYVDAANAILVGAALIASVTFGGWLQPPFGDGQMSTDKVVRIFWAFNSLSFFFAVGTVMAGAAAVLPLSDLYIEDAVENLRRWLVGTAFVFICSIGFVLGAFAAAGFASLSHLPHLRVNMIYTTIIGSLLCGWIGILFFYRLFRIPRFQLKDGIRATWDVLFPARSNSKKESDLSNTSSRGKPVWNLSRAPLRESRGMQDSNSLPSVLDSVTNKAGEVDDFERLAKELVEIQLGHQPGEEFCLFRKCCERCPVSEVGWLSENLLPRNTKMWKSISEKLQASRSAANARKHASFLFQDESEEFTLSAWTSADEDESTLASGTIQGEASTPSGVSRDESSMPSGHSALASGSTEPSGTIQDGSLERFGINVGVGNLANNLFIKRLDSLNRQAREDLAKDYGKEPVAKTGMMTVNEAFYSEQEPVMVLGQTSDRSRSQVRRPRQDSRNFRSSRSPPRSSAYYHASSWFGQRRSSASPPRSRPYQQGSSLFGQRRDDHYLETVKLHVPLCCEACEERISNHMLGLEGVESVTCDQVKQKVTVRGTASPSEVLRQGRECFKNTTFW